MMSGASQYGHAAQEQFDKRPCNGPAWLEALRRESLEAFAQIGFPTPKQEMWKYTNVAPITRRPFRSLVATNADANDLRAAIHTRMAALPANDHVAVLVDGILVSHASRLAGLPQGVLVARLDQLVVEQEDLIEPVMGRIAHFHEHAFVALNTALHTGGVGVLVPRGAKVEHPIHLLHVSSGRGNTPQESPEPRFDAASYPRVAVFLAPESTMTLVEHFVPGAAGAQEYLCNGVTELSVGANARLDHYTLQQQHPRSFHLHTVGIRLQRSASYASHSLSTGAALARNVIRAHLWGAASTCDLNGIYLGRGSQHVDNHLRVDHSQPHCRSAQVYKGVLDDHAEGVFSGCVFVAKDSQKTSARQLNRNLLLSKSAAANTRPTLEILADDVACSHGATVGRLDEEALFYLRSRGVDAASARRMLTYAFAADVLDLAGNADMRDFMRAQVMAWLSPSEAEASEGTLARGDTP